MFSDFFESHKRSGILITERLYQYDKQYLWENGKVNLSMDLIIFEHQYLLKV